MSRLWETVASEQTKTLIRAYAQNAVAFRAGDLPGLLADLQASADDPYFIACEVAEISDVELGIDSPEFDNLCTTIKVWIGELELKELRQAWMCPGVIMQAKPQYANPAEHDLRFELVEILSPTAVRVKIVSTGKILDLASTMFESA